PAHRGGRAEWTFGGHLVDGAEPRRGRTLRAPRGGPVGLAGEARPAWPAPPEEPGDLPQERSLPGDRAGIDDRPWGRVVQDQLDHVQRAGGLRPPGIDP